ncbi:acyl-CoA dehydrogenase family protein [Burkholderia vietnamiensis]|uniref:Acyl-CoA dehydrogenase family protein n=1 Tax=Burkholderia vietnamiensis TaxID=60552 RepID=A0AAW7SZ77_BURVI|nr:acyl-CoA dehydrogenase family protein [Burkholderia vietnamiensis]MBH9645805.1 acyl-CoA dehydrogenase family protein [Burkholderia vietnamiensis]MBR8008921.1 acyl-CoA dehydrogenase family protein [Burkholderia vietnamiensis]MDN7551260.1 acyl-CoA dehydrogenase family protein [Burkholderia vietnamiensis]MDN7795074.1 acyl-CoA dehydrogenase family protein [Burkholderia vietnamiensis]MDN8044427.1 acyl-CoA dehydrogenase family protein [Burkholderia vietnamiensis]
MLPKLYRHAWMDSDIEAFREQVRRYISAEFTPKLDDWRRQGYIPRETWRPFGEMGFLLPEMDEAYGGAGANLAYQLVVQDELAKAEMPVNIAVHTIASHYILAYGTEAQKQRWLPKVTNGEMLAAIAMTEPGCGSDLKAISTRARRDGDHYVIDGAKTFITNGFTGNLLIVAARTGEPGSSGLSLFVLETEDLPGFHVGRLLEKIGMQASDTAELFFDGVRVHAEQLLGGTEGLGFKQLMGQLPYERMLIAVPAAAVIDQALALTVEYTQQRKAFGARLFDMQNTRLKLAEVATTAHVVRSFVNDCIQRLLDGTLDDEAAYMAKWWCTEQQCRVTDECLQLFGGYGYMAEYPIARMYAASRVQKIYGGANEVMKDLIARKL